MQQVAIAENQVPGVAAQPSQPRQRRAWYVILALCFFAAVIPESIATWNTSVARIIANPTDLLFIMLFYGPADLLIREAIVRRRLGWGSLVLLGIAFGFLNEGVVAGTWYTVQNSGYVFVGQIDYTWAVALTIFHLFESVIAPIAFIETVFPSHAGRPLLRRRGIVISAVVFLLVTALVAFVPAYRAYRFAVFALALVLAIVGFRLPSAPPRKTSTKAPPRLWALWLAGFGANLAFWVVIFLIPAIMARVIAAHMLVAQAVDIIIMALFSVWLLRVGRGWTASAGWSLRHSLALIAGVLTFPILLNLLPPFWNTLEPLLNLPFLALTIWLDFRLRRRERASQGHPVPALAPGPGDLTHSEQAGKATP